MGALAAVINKKDGDATSSAVTMLESIKLRRVDTFGLASPTIVKTKSSLLALKDKFPASPVAIGYAFSKILSADKPQPMKLEQATFVFEGRIYPKPRKLSDAENAAKNLQQNHQEAMRKLLQKAEGDFSMVLAEPERITAGRDPVGVRPLYYGENATLAALASERKALWAIGIEQANSFPPGHVACVDNTGFKFDPVRTLTASNPKRTTMQAAARKLLELLTKSTRERVSGIKEVAVAFSGGLDSSIIAFLAKKTGANVHLVHVSLKDEPETEQARETAEELKLPLHVCLHEKAEVAETLLKALRVIEEPDPVKASIGVPLYWAAEEAVRMGFTVVLAGQGADELFGGYRRYVEEYSKSGSEEVQHMMFADVAASHEINYERDVKICNFHGLELRLPFATYQIARFAISLPLELKIRIQDEGLRKLVLRRVAKNLGMSDSVVEKPKKAIQYATGVNRVLERLAKNEGVSVREYVQKRFREVFSGMTSHD